MFNLKKQSLLVIFTLFISNVALTKEWKISPSKNAQDEIQTALILAEPGDRIILASGSFNLMHGLSLDVDNVILEGAGMDKTFLIFDEQKTGAQGLLVTSDNVTLQNFAVINAKGDAIKSKGADKISFLNLKTEWTNGPDSLNGAYGLYPVESTRVLIDGCVAIGASDAGIYVGQSEQIIVRNSRAEYNVAGIEIENSYYADVYDNVTTNNTGGILVFDLPNLPKQGGKFVRVFRNKSFANNTDNFAPEGNIVGEVPRGTGVIIMANRNVEVFDNDIFNHETINVAIVAGDLESGDDSYDPYPKKVQIHSNRIFNSGYNPDLTRGDLGPILGDVAKGDMPDILWDGVLPISQVLFGQNKQEKMILQNNGRAKFLDLDAVRYVALPFFHSPSRNISEFEGAVTPLPEVAEW